MGEQLPFAEETPLSLGRLSSVAGSHSLSQGSRTLLVFLTTFLLAAQHWRLNDVPCQSAASCRVWNPDRLRALPWLRVVQFTGWLWVLLCCRWSWLGPESAPDACLSEDPQGQCMAGALGRTNPRQAYSLQETSLVHAGACRCHWV